MVSLSVRMRVSDSFRKELLDVARFLVEPVRVQKGCVGSQLLEDINDTGYFWLEQEWDDTTTLVQHIQSERFKALLVALGLLKGEWYFATAFSSHRFESNDFTGLLEQLGQGLKKQKERQQ